MFDFCFDYKHICSFSQAKKENQSYNSKQILCPGTFIFDKKNINLIANEVLSLDSWQIAILALSTESLEFFVCWIVLTWFRK